MGIKVAKFGGTSLANAAQIRKCATIVQSDPERRFVVVSAPGKRWDGDTKITDTLIECYNLASSGGSIDSPFFRVEERFMEIAEELGVGEGIAPHLADAKREIQLRKNYDFSVSVGERLCATLVGEYLDFPFVDAKSLIFLDHEGQVRSKSYDLMKTTLAKMERAIIPGFYGASEEGEIKTFSRGGSDITGALIARGVGAEVYENWTDVSGLLKGDPRIIETPPVPEMSYVELRELSVIGANIFHHEAVLPVSSAGIPINIRNTNEPDAPGTMIRKKREGGDRGITAVSGKTGVSAFRFHLTNIGDNLEVQHRLKMGLAASGWRQLLLSTRCDDLLIVLEPGDNRTPSPSEVLSLSKTLSMEGCFQLPPLCLVGVIGEGIGEMGGVITSLIGRLSTAGMPPYFTAHGVSSASVVLGLEESLYKEAIRLLLSPASLQ